MREGARRHSWFRAGRLIPLIALLLLVACGRNTRTTATAAATVTSAASAPSPAATRAPATVAATTPTAAATPRATAAVTATPATTPVARVTATATPATPVASPSVTATVSAYFLKSDKVATVHRKIAGTPQVAHAALTELLSGPSKLEAAAGYTTSIPSGTTLRNVSIANGVATADLSSEFAGQSGGPMPARLAQVVYTLTQFPNVDSVTVKVAGAPLANSSVPQPAKRSDFEDLTPAIFVDRPALGDTVTSPVRLVGTANVFEAQFVVQVVDVQGKVLTEQSAKATSGTGTRGTFDVTVPFTVTTQQAGKIVVFDRSPKDGSQMDVVEIPVTLSP